MQISAISLGLTRPAPSSGAGYHPGYDLLAESGAYLVLESGDSILLEQQ